MVIIYTTSLVLADAHETLKVVADGVGAVLLTYPMDYGLGKSQTGANRYTRQIDLACALPEITMIFCEGRPARSCDGFCNSTCASNLNAQGARGMVAEQLVSVPTAESHENYLWRNEEMVKKRAWRRARKELLGNMVLWIFVVIFHYLLVHDQESTRAAVGLTAMIYIIPPVAVGYFIWTVLTTYEDPEEGNKDE